MSFNSQLKITELKGAKSPREEPKKKEEAKKQDDGKKKATAEDSKQAKTKSGKDESSF